MDDSSSAVNNKAPEESQDIEVEQPGSLADNKAPEEFQDIEVKQPGSLADNKAPEESQDVVMEQVEAVDDGGVIIPPVVQHDTEVGADDYDQDGTDENGDHDGVDDQAWDNGETLTDKERAHLLTLDLFSRSEDMKRRRRKRFEEEAAEVAFKLSSP